jgi:serine/threonine-protein kinase mTOR
VVQTVDGLAKKVNFSDHASLIIHPLVHVLNDPYAAPELATAVLDTLSMLLIQLGADFAIFVPMINKSLRRHTRLNHMKYDDLVNRLLNREPLP